MTLSRVPLPMIGRASAAILVGAFALAPLARAQEPAPATVEASPSPMAVDASSAAAPATPPVPDVPEVQAVPAVPAAAEAPAAAPSTSKLTINNGFLLYDNRVTGSAQSSSFLTPGKHTQESLALLFTAKPSTIAWEASLEGRFTDDERIDKKHLSVLKTYLKGDTEQGGGVVGDFYASFSDYTLGKSLKGGQMTRKFATGTQLTALAGIDKANWDDLWNHNRGETVDRQVYGVRAQQTFLTDGTVGANFVASKDQRARYDETDLAIDQRVASVDWVLPRYHKLSLSGESAYAFSQNDQPGTDPDTNEPNSAHSTKKGWAHKVHALYSVGRFKSTDDFERVSPDYQTTVGSASPDLISAKTANTWTISGPWKWVVLNYTYFHNNLFRQEGVAVATTRMPESGLRYEAPDWRPDFAFEVKLRHREVTSTDGGLRHRTRSVVSSVADRFGPLSLEVDYEFQHEDKSDATASARHHILGIASSALFKAKDWKFAPGLKWDLQRDRDNLIGKTDQTGTVRANALVTSPWGADLGGTYSRALVLPATSPGNDRRTWLGSLGYNILHKDDHRVEIRFKQNDNRFDDPDKDFKEMVWEFELKDKF